MEKNKTGKYLKYAIGEILLVMIGILLALQVNNWNENRKNSSIEKETLSNLKADLKSSLVQLNNKIDQNEYYTSQDSILLDAIQFKKELPKDSLGQLMLSHIWTPTFDPELGALNEILSTGKMIVIKNHALRNHISSWNKYMYELNEATQILVDFDKLVKTPFYSKHIPYKNRFSYATRNLPASNYYPKSNFTWDPVEVIYTLEFENMLINYILYSNIQLERFLDVKMKINEMIALIDDEL